MAKRPGITSPFRAALSPDEMRKAISRFRKLRERFEQFEPDTVVSGDDPKISELASASQIALEKTYPPGTTQNQQYRDLSNFEYSFPQYAGQETPVYQVHEGLKSAKSKAIVLLRQAIEDLEEDLGDASEPVQLPVPTVSSTLERTVFVVHGHDGESREAIARFLEKLQFKPIILPEQPGSGRTIIEKLRITGPSDSLSFCLRPMTR